MIRSLITVEISGADIPQTLCALNRSEIILLRTHMKDELTVEVTMLRQDIGKAQEICRKRGDSLRILEREGWYWPFKSLLSRPVLMFGLALLLFCALWLPSRVLFVQVEGNALVPARKILEMADQCGIGFGARRRGVRSEKMKNALLEKMPELQWAGVNTRGCVAVISVRERPVRQATVESPSLCHIVAVADGVISQCTATRGTLLCIPGQAVEAGEILISGYTDSGLTIRAEAAQGEIYGHTLRTIESVTPTFRGTVSEYGPEMKKISLLIGKKRINLWKDSGIWEGTCDRMYEEYYITLPGGFQLPLGLTVERYHQRQVSQQEIPQTHCRRLLETAAQAHLCDAMIAGTIVRTDLSYTQEPGVLRMAGEYRCTELIGVPQRFQIGEQNGKND